LDSDRVTHLFAVLVFEEKSPVQADWQCSRRLQAEGDGHQVVQHYPQRYVQDDTGLAFAAVTGVKRVVLRGEQIAGAPLGLIHDEAPTFS